MSLRSLARPVALSARQLCKTTDTAASVARARTIPTLATSSSQISRSDIRLYSAAPPTGLDQGELAIYKKLSETFPGQRLEVQDVSGGCGSFYAILISSPKFNGLSTIKQHKLVNACLKEDIQGIHGLQASIYIAPMVSITGERYMSNVWPGWVEGAVADV